MRSSRLAEPQSLTALETAEPSAGVSIAGTLIAAIAADKDSTANTFCALVFCRMETTRTTSVAVTASVLTISASETRLCRFMARVVTESHETAQRNPRCQASSGMGRRNHRL